MSFSNDDAPNPYQSPLTASETPLPTTDVRLATKMNRLGAAIIDGIIGMALSLPVMFFTGYFQRAMQGGVGLGEMAFVTLYGFVMFFVVHGYLLATRGQTVGKMLAKIQIVDYHSDQILPFAKLIGLRYIPVWLVSLIPYVNFLGVIDILFIFGRERRCVHDYIAGTKVIDVTA